MVRVAEFVRNFRLIAQSPRGFVLKVPENQRREMSDVLLGRELGCVSAITQGGIGNAGTVKKAE